MWMKGCNMEEIQCRPCYARSQQKKATKQPKEREVQNDKGDENII